MIMGLDQYFYLKKNNCIVSDFFYYLGFGALHLYMCKLHNKELESKEYPLSLKDVRNLKNKVKSLLLILCDEKVLNNEYSVEFNPIDNSIIITDSVNNNTEINITKEFIDECEKTFPTSELYCWGGKDYDIVHVNYMFLLYKDLLKIEDMLNKDNLLELTYDSWW